MPLTSAQEACAAPTPDTSRVAWVAGLHLLSRVCVLCVCTSVPLLIKQSTSHVAGRELDQILAI